MSKGPSPHVSSKNVTDRQGMFPIIESCASGGSVGSDYHSFSGRWLCVTARLWKKKKFKKNSVMLRHVSVCGLIGTCNQYIRQFVIPKEHHWLFSIKAQLIGLRSIRYFRHCVSVFLF